MSAAQGLDRCPTCGKVRFLTKTYARRAARRMKGRVGRLNAYRCGEFWHLGHLPTAVRHGAAARDDIYPPSDPNGAHQ